MNKRSFIIKLGLAVVGVGLLVGAVLFVLDYLSWKNVSFTLSPDTKSAVIYYWNGDKEHDSTLVEATRLSSSSTIRLKTGTYTAVPSGDKVSSSQIDFTVTNDMSVDITPYYSDDYLAKTFNGEIPAINTVLSKKYPFVATGYTIDTGRFYHTGDWYATTLYTSTPEPGNGVDIYGVLLHKTDGIWSVVNAPTLVFTYAAFSSVSKDIVDSANQQLFGL